ncbi:hypothetical protein Y032_0638g976 [Ancylostoma ceylanicum]|uniref:Uncharacterized protein n=1 Tax=Ancylostoma ceylanicum TaxID=53326 RepID=A0A016WJP4_9BILA|nr:hypothetical protein Y032_0638g976 [Ancylostoma ceylanicum]
MTSIPACAARLRGVLAEAVDRSRPSRLTVILDEKQLAQSFCTLFKVCIEARRQRFNETKRKEYEEAANKAFSSEADIRSAVDLRKTV